MKRVLLSVVGILMLTSQGDVFGHDDPGTVKKGTLSGQVIEKGGGPLHDGMVFFFNSAEGPAPSSTHYWRLPSEAFRIDKNGRFTAELIEGQYYLGAMKKLSGELFGPPAEGDLFFISQDEQGKPKLHSVKKQETRDLGILAAIPFRRSQLAKEGITSIAGVVKDADGRPMEGVLVFAFVTQSMVGRPYFVSDKTDADGRYLMRVHEGGKYFLRVRGNYGGGPPAAGEPMGVYGEREPVTVKTDEHLKGIDIITMKFPGRGPKKED